MYRDIQQSVQFLNIKLLKGTIVYTTCTKMAGADKITIIGQKFMIAQRLVMKFMSEKCALRKGGFSKKPLSVILKKKNHNNKKTTRLRSQACPHHHRYSHR